MSGFVYFIGPTDWRLNRIKIGHTTCAPESRLAAMQTGSPFPLELYAFFRGARSVEQLLHETFAPVREHGEWFRMEGKLLAIVSCAFMENYGKSALSDVQIDSILNENLFAEEPPQPTFSTIDEWTESANVEVINQWLHDRAFAAYQAKGECV